MSDWNKNHDLVYAFICVSFLADGEVAMTTAYNGRIFNAVAVEKKPFEIVWDGQVYDIDLWATSNCFKMGHSIRIEISSSNFPRFDRNSNTGNVISEDRKLLPALQKVLHTAEFPSYITLPIVPHSN